METRPMTDDRSPSREKFRKKNNMIAPSITIHSCTGNAADPVLYFVIIIIIIFFFCKRFIADTSGGATVACGGIGLGAEVKHSTVIIYTYTPYQLLYVKNKIKSARLRRVFAFQVSLGVVIIIIIFRLMIIIYCVTRRYCIIVIHYKWWCTIGEQRDTF